MLLSINLQGESAINERIAQIVYGTMVQLFPVHYRQENNIYHS